MDNLRLRIVPASDNNVIFGEKLLVFMPIIYSVGFIYSETLRGLGMIISFFSVIGFWYGYSCIKEQSTPSFEKRSAYLLFFYSIISLVLTLEQDYDGYRSIFLNPALILPYICCLLMTKRYNYRVVKIILKGIGISAILFIIFSIINFSQFLSGGTGRNAIRILHDSSISFDTVSKSFASCVGLGLLFFLVLKKRLKIIYLSAFAINILMAIFLGRRNIIFTNCLYLIAACYLYARYAHISGILRNAINTFGLVVIVYAGLNFQAFLKDSTHPLFQTLNERFDIDSRGDVLNFYDKDMNSNPLNWVIGKGIDSKYYCPGIEETKYRRTVEAGWRQIIMKVGCIGFFLYLLILLPAVFKKKRNLLTKACGIYILIGLIELYPAGVPTFYLQYVLLWIAASICYDQKFNHTSVETLKKILL